MPEERPSGLHPEIEDALHGLGDRETHWPAYQELHEALKAHGHPAAQFVSDPEYLKRVYAHHRYSVTDERYRDLPQMKQHVQEAIARGRSGRLMVAPEVGRFVENLIRHSDLPPTSQKFRRRTPRPFDPVRKAALHYGSPSIKDQSVEEAFQALQSPSHGQFRDNVRRIIGSEPRDAVGAWVNGAENSVAAQRNDTTEDDADRIAAQIGLAHNQKTTLHFREFSDGPDHLHRFDLPMGPVEAHHQLLNHGIDFHTIIPTESGVEVHIWDQGKRLGKIIGHLAHETGTAVHTKAGKGKLVGDPDSRENAQAVYHAILDRGSEFGGGQRLNRPLRRSSKVRERGPTGLFLARNGSR